MSKNIMVLGLGNILLKDEGIGVHIAQELKKKVLAENIKVVDGGTAAFDILASTDDIDKLIIVDAIKTGGRPATIYLLHPQDLTGNSQQALSLHQVDILQMLSASEKLGNLPKEVVIIGVEPKEINWGLRLSPELEHKVPDIIKIVLCHCEEAFITRHCEGAQRPKQSPFSTSLQGGQQSQAMEIASPLRDTGKWGNYFLL